MYRTCIFCSADLGANDSVEEFPVGRSLAFDAARGRLWAVCPKCARWNLAPIEERWEAVETSEKLFRDARLRAQSENVGLARLPDGTRLIRIGPALPGELAVWRYGDQLVRRRRYYLAATVAGASVATAALGGIALTALGVSTALNLYHLGSFLWRRRRDGRVVYRRPGTGDTEEVRVLRRHLPQAYLATVPESDEIEVHVPEAERVVWHTFDGGRVARFEVESLALRGPEARAVLGRAMVFVNARGASHRMVQSALELLTDAGSAEEYVRSTAARKTALGRVAEGDSVVLAPTGALALEMALHEETERRALEGELAALEAAWREAEEIAAIADALPPDPLDRLKQR
ncbi:MAG TPA: hypothetical protein VHG28_00685 [Longimicrobiaceae bacterium]|nr:hypothetical protein [Longimicrobiaceae bacterium]